MRKALFLLGILNDSDLDWIVAAGTRQEVLPGSTLIHEGQPVGSVFVIIEGLLAVRTRRSGAADLALLRAGEVVGEMSFVDSRPPSASVISVEPSVVLAIPHASLEAKLGSDVAFAARFYRSLAVFLSDRLRTTSGRLGYGGADTGAVEPDEMDPSTLDAVTLAGARFEWLAQRLRSR